MIYQIDDRWLENQVCDRIAVAIDCDLIDAHMRSTPQQSHWDEVPPREAYALTDELRERIRRDVLRYRDVTDDDLPRLYDEIQGRLYEHRARAIDCCLRYDRRVERLMGYDL